MNGTGITDNMNKRGLSDSPFCSFERNNSHREERTWDYER